MKLSLNGDWKLAQAGKKSKIPAQVPGSVHTDLLRAAKISDPFYRDNESSLRWIGRTDWTYARAFTVSATLLHHDRVILRCEGLDTLATVFINDQKIAATDNMYRTWEFNVRGILRPGRNTIEIRFASAENYCVAQHAARPLFPHCAPHEPKGRYWLRKEPCSFGWDWGPVLVTCGIWRSIDIVAFDQRLTGVEIRQRHSRDTVTLTVTPEIDGRPDGLRARVTVSHEGKTVASREISCASEISAECEIRSPRLWWPINMGKQPQYDVVVELVDANGEIVDTQSRRIGLRTLRLDRHADQWGESFQFVVNGIPFFAKGANWIPADALVTRMTPQRYRTLLQDAAAVNMNMLRVWGGGIYEEDVFYDICDELGICVWQDFMFACSSYPVYDAAFLDNVKAEAEDNVRRIRHHACIALWCGNNEMEPAVADDWTDWQMSRKDYGRLFDKLLPEVVNRLSPEADYWPSSPHTPVGDRKECNNPKSGDAHLWEVWHGRKPFEWYRTCEHRFNSEFGFQSFPEPKTVHAFTAMEDRNVTSRIMEHHQRCAVGNTVIMQYMCDWFKLPTAFDSTLWLSQILQGMAMKYAVEHWRRSMPRGMGTLYWQINDTWPVASWASIDYHGRWKALHYMARNFFAPVLVSGLENLEKGTVEIHLTSDAMEKVAGVVGWRVTDATGTVLDKGSIKASAAARRDVLVDIVDMSALIAKHEARNLLVWLEFKTGTKTVSDNLVLFARPKHLELRDPRIAVAVEEIGDHTFAVTLTAQHPALWTWLELEGHDAGLSDNFFHLRPGAKRRITLSTQKTLSLARVRRALRVRSLVDTFA